MNIQSSPKTAKTAKTATLQDLIDLLESGVGPAGSRRRDLISDLRTAAKLLRRNPSEIRADMEDLQRRFAGIHPVQAGVSPKRLANIRSSVERALRIARIAPRSKKPSDRLPEWEVFLDGIDQEWNRYSLAQLANFASAKGIPPEGVDSALLPAFRAHLAASNLGKDPDKTVKITTQTWNGIIAGSSAPLCKLDSPTSDRFRTIPLKDFPRSFQADLEVWIDRLKGGDIWDGDGPAKPLKPNSLQNTRATVRQFATALVHSGHPIETITDLSALVDLQAYKDGLRHIHTRFNGQTPTWLAGMAAKLLAIARHHVKLPEAETAKLLAIKTKLVVERTGMTDKNRARLSQFDDPRNVGLLLSLPQQLLKRAEAASRPSPRAMPST
ncbi:hypothetical protein [uncultured Albimonas sp.]|uniref:hypothetical protein n=1 Tax=uncultured Albimonas sp. TaxID=1331701 RepID=UPI0030EF78EE|tara:strand:+ start:1098 stop:2246 length:1149 start_codon:yes stop_codon:yes gene_type:complete